MPQSSNAALHYTRRLGFDAHNAPAVDVMGTWWDTSPFFDVGIYVGGDNYCGVHSPTTGKCTSRPDPNLNAQWVTKVQGEGWGFFPIWVGPQAPCVLSSGFAEFTTANAGPLGTSNADSAAAAMTTLGLSGSVVFYDMENYDITNTSCSQAVRTFLTAWVKEMNTDGFQTTAVYGNPGPAENDFSQVSGLTQMGASTNGTAVSNYAYTLGLAGNRLTVAELSGRTVNYGYDSLYRLTGETVSGDPHNNNGAASYTYDAAGNRKTFNTTIPPAGGNTYTYDADDRLGSDQYDADGNTISSLGVANTYDFENHLLTHGGATVVYDGDGNRVSETVGNVTTNYLVDTVNPTGYAQVVDELVSGTVARTYSYGLERISETQSINSALTTSFYGYDGHGSVRQLTGSSGTVTDTYAFDAFGNLISSTGSTPNNYLFAGEQYDPALSLYYNRARYLNTTTGRFWSMDTEEGSPRDPLSLHKYLYAANNPGNLVDPSGRDFDLGSVTAALGDSLTIASQSVVQFGTVLGNIYYTLGPVAPLLEKGAFYLLAGTVALALLSEGANVASTGLSRLANNVSSYDGEGLSQVPTVCGRQMEQCAQTNLGTGFPAFDNFENGEATQLFTTTRSDTPQDLIAAISGKVNQWQKVYDSRDVFSGQASDGTFISISKDEITTKNMLVVTSPARFSLSQIATQLEQLQESSGLDQIVVQESELVP